MKEKDVTMDATKMTKSVNAPEKEVKEQKEITMAYKNYNYNTGSDILINRKQRRHGRFKLR